MTKFEYSCSTANKFSFLNESEDVEDPSEILANIQAKQTKETATAKKETKGAEKKTTKPTGQNAVKKDTKKQPLQQQADNSKQGDKKPKTGGERKPGQDNNNRKPGSAKEPRAVDKENTNKNRTNEGGFSARGPRPEGEKPFRPRPVRREGEEGQQQGGENTGFGGEQTEFRRGGGGGGGGFRGPRQQGDRQQGERQGGRGGFRGQRRTPHDGEHLREFDRHSGSDKTGVKAVDKKDGAGKSNWGTYNDELAAEGEVATEVNEQKQADWAARVEENEENKVEEGEDKEVAPNLMTLEEYKALKNEIKKKNDFNIRRPGEGEDPSKWKNTYVLPKKPADENENEEEEEEEEEEEQDEEEEKRKKLLNQIQIKFYEQPSQRGDRRGDRRPPGQPRNDRRNEQETTTEGTGPNESSPEKQPRRNNKPSGPRGPRGGNFKQQKEKPLNFDDKEFPSLGK